MTQEVILLEDVEGLGTRGATVRVAPGYARNYLLPHRKAIAAAQVGQRMRTQLERGRAQRETRERASAEAQKRVLDGMLFTFERQVGDEDKLYGSVSAQDIHEALAAKGHDVDRRRILLHEPIKALGSFVVQVRCYADIVASITVHVAKAHDPEQISEMTPADAEGVPANGDVAPSNTE
jgi:large subunit ribosomal protein L9